MPMLQVYSRKGCHLCEVLLETLVPMVRGRFTIEVLDIDSQPAWRAEYGTRIPVVEMDGRTICEYRLDREAILDLLEQDPETDGE